MRIKADFRMTSRKRHFSIYFVLLIFIGGLVILPLCSGLTWLGMDLQKRIDASTLESNETFIQQVASNTDQLIEITNYATSVLMVDREILLNMRGLVDTSDTYEHYRTKVALSKRLSSLESSVLHAVDGKIALLSASGYLLGSNGMEQVADGYGQAEWFQRIRTNGRKTTFDSGIASLFQRLQLDTEIKPYQYLYVGRSILDYSGEYLGMVVVQISTSRLWDRYLDTLDTSSGLYLYEDEPRTLHIAYFPDGGAEPDLEAMNLNGMESGQSVHGVEAGQYYMAYHLTGAPFLLIFTESADSFYRAGWQVVRNTWGLIIALIAATLTVLILISRYITRPFTTLIRNLESQRDGALHVNAGKYAFREMDELVTSYNEAGRRISELIAQVRLESRLREEANYEVLISQISPHFLFNTVNSIKIMANQASDSEVAEALAALGDVLHLVYEAKADMTTIGCEMQLVMAYVKIMKMRFGNAFQYVDIVPTELYHVEIPAFTLQPIVENAILHGVRDMAAGQIVVSAILLEGDIELSVFNNGETPDLETLQRILTEPPERRGKITGIGLSNINRRVKLLYGEAYGLSINEDVNVGLEIRVRIPLHEM